MIAFRSLTILRFLAALIVAGPAFAGDAAGDRVPTGPSVPAQVQTCNGCHGDRGEGQPASGVPRIGGLNGIYLSRQLLAFGDGTRVNSVMTPIAKTLDAPAVAEVAAYYASLAPLRSTMRSAAAASRGETLALHGAWSANVPPCASCHGRRGLGVGSLVPPIAGQPARYIADQLRAWKSGTRSDDPLGLMAGVGRRLDDDQIAAVADYYAGLSTDPAPQAAGGPRR